MIFAALAMILCPESGKRHHCVHDPDTWWVNGVKVRVIDIDSPEKAHRAQCDAERRLERVGARRTVELLNDPRATIEFTGQYDRYGRELVRAPFVAETLIREGLARRWRGRREQWCN